ncbi:outer membrane protein assembly factor BamC [Paludibacterium yongneupense]|uniref:outer membrane protein assembly factor BamC n=1 Tax=Paludibacterium yongneupense TaxID=400061 RepID=UPI000428F2F3|nr:outer membrane protein assembly factor BamC [Paludibacterium yongneupense]
MKRSAPVAILLATGLIAGCSTTDPVAKADFKSVVAPVNQTEKLEVPPDLTAPQQQSKYVIPGNGAALASQASPQAAAAATTPAAKPAAASAAPVVPDNVQMVRAGSQRWVTVDNKSAAELWPLLKAFWQDNGFVIADDEPDVGIMETEWAENRAKLPNDGLRKLMESVGIGSVYSTGERDKFRIRLEKGEHGTEVYFSHRGMVEVYIDQYKNQTMWQPRPSDPDLEGVMLARFMQRLGVSDEQASAAVKKTALPKVEPKSPIVGGTLGIDDAFDRAWRRVGLALDRIGLVVTDRDRSQGLYYVKPAKNEVDKPEEKSGGFWSSLAFWKSSTPSGLKPSDVDARIQVKETTAGHTDITVLDKQGKPLLDSFSRNTLEKLHSELD